MEPRLVKNHEIAKLISPQAQEHSELFPRLLGLEERFGRAEPMRNQAKMAGIKPGRVVQMIANGNP
jgi:hypothetical protein